MDIAVETVHPPPHVTAARTCAACLDRLAETLRDACVFARLRMHEDAAIVSRMLVETLRIAAARELRAVGVASLGMTSLPFAAEAEAVIVDLGLDGADHAEALAEQVRAWAREAVRL